MKSKILTESKVCGIVVMSLKSGIPWSMIFLVSKSCAFRFQTTLQKINCNYSGKMFLIGTFDLFCFVFTLSFVFLKENFLEPSVNVWTSRLLFYFFLGRGAWSFEVTCFKCLCSLKVPVCPCRL